MGDSPQQHNATALGWSAEREFTPYFAEAAASSTKTTQVNLLMGRTVLARASDTMVAIDFPVGNLNNVLSLAATKTRDTEDSLTTIFVQRHSANASVPVLAGASRGKVVRYNGDSGTMPAHTWQQPRSHLTIHVGWLVGVCSGAVEQIPASESTIPGVVSASSSLNTVAAHSVSATGTSTGGDQVKSLTIGEGSEQYYVQAQQLATSRRPQQGTEPEFPLRLAASRTMPSWAAINATSVSVLSVKEFEEGSNNWDALSVLSGTSVIIVSHLCLRVCVSRQMSVGGSCLRGCCSPHISRPLRSLWV